MVPRCTNNLVTETSVTLLPTQGSNKTKFCIVDPLLWEQGSNGKSNGMSHKQPDVLVQPTDCVGGWPTKDKNENNSNQSNLASLWVCPQRILWNHHQWVWPWSLWQKDQCFCCTERILEWIHCVVEDIVGGGDCHNQWMMVGAIQEMILGPCLWGRG